MSQVFFCCGTREVGGVSGVSRSKKTARKITWKGIYTI